MNKTPTFGKGNRKPLNFKTDMAAGVNPQAGLEDTQPEPLEMQLGKAQEIYDSLLEGTYKAPSGVKAAEEILTQTSGALQEQGADLEGLVGPAIQQLHRTAAAGAIDLDPFGANLEALTLSPSDKASFEFYREFKKLDEGLNYLDFNDELQEDGMILKRRASLAKLANIAQQGPLGMQELQREETNLFPEDLYNLSQADYPKPDMSKISKMQWDLSSEEAYGLLESEVLTPIEYGLLSQQIANRERLPAEYQNALQTLKDSEPEGLTESERDWRYRYLISSDEIKPDTLERINRSSNYMIKQRKSGQALKGLKDDLPNMNIRDINKDEVARQLYNKTIDRSRLDESLRTNRQLLKKLHHLNNLDEGRDDR